MLVFKCFPFLLGETHFITFVAYRNLKALMQPGDDQK